MQKPILLALKLGAKKAQKPIARLKRPGMLTERKATCMSPLTLVYTLKVACQITPKLLKRWHRLMAKAYYAAYPVQATLIYLKLYKLTSLAPRKLLKLIISIT